MARIELLKHLLRSGRRVLAAMWNRPGLVDPPEDPRAPVREPRRRSPGGRSSAVAVEEPESGDDVTCVSTRRWSS